MAGIENFEHLSDTAGSNNSGWRPHARIVAGYGGPVQGTNPPSLVKRSDPAWANLQSQLSCPVAFAPDPCARAIYVLDVPDGRVSTMDLTSGEIRILPGVGGHGAMARQLVHPRGVAVLADGSTVVADTENHRVQVFTTFPHALVQLWGRRDGTPGSGLLEFKWPWGVAANTQGTVIYVVDRGNRRIQKIRADGSGAWEIGNRVMQDPTDIAVSPAGDIAVVDSGKNLWSFLLVVGVPDYRGRRQPDELGLRCGQ